MSGRWFYSHEGQILGPYSTEEIQALAAQNKILEHDLLWEDGADPKDAASADAALDFSKLTCAPASAKSTPAKSTPAKSTPAEGTPSESTPGAAALPMPGPTPAPGVRRTPPPASAPLPDWLRDEPSTETVAKKEQTLSREATDPSAVASRRGEAVPPLPSASGGDAPDWLEDLRLWVGLELYAPPPSPPPSPEPKDTATAAEASPALAPPEPASQLPDWLEGWSIPEAPKPTDTDVYEDVELVPLEAGVDETGVKEKGVEETAAELFLSPPEEPAEAPKPPPLPTAVPLAKPVTVPRARPVPKARPGAADADRVAEQTVQETGFDPRSGKIVDQDKFRKWKQKKPSAASSGAGDVSNASLFEVFRKARTEIEQWVDDDKNRLRILYAEIVEIKRNPEVQAIVDKFANYGPTLKEKLIQHLQFMVENRRKHYQARKKGGK
jgi:hypothetical protein